jgi:phosphatidyl-myo-inositol dimannoside synthase
MKILMLDNEYPPLGGGMGTVNQALLHEFSALPDLHIDLVTSALGDEFEQLIHSERIRIYKVPVQNNNIHHSSNPELLRYSWHSFLLARKLYRQQRYQLCFAWSAVPAGAVAYALYREFSLPYLVWVSGPDIPGFERRYRYLYPLLLPLLRRVWKAARVTIVKCQGEADMIHRYEPHLPLHIIPNGVDRSTFKSPERHTHQGPLRVICVARLIERKGQHHLLQAARQLLEEGIDLQVSLVGTGDSLSEFQNLAADLHITHRVSFSGYVAREDLPEHFSKADVFVLPSFNEGMSLAALEALSSGLPLLLTRTGGTEWLVKDGFNGYSFDWGNVDSLAQCLRKLATNRHLLVEMGRASHQLASHYEWNKISSRYLDLFSASIADRSPV